MSEGVDLSAVLARDARKLRGAANLDDVARAARGYGLNWGTGRVSDLEHGRVSPTVSNLVALALTLAEVRGEYLTLGDLLRSDDNIAITKDLAVTSDELQGFLSGGEVSLGERHLAELTKNAKDAFASLREGWPRRLQKVRPGQLRRMRNDYGEPEMLLARDVGLDKYRLIAEMAALWGKSYSAKRDELAGPGANAQKKGRVARELKAQLSRSSP